MELRELLKDISFEIATLDQFENVPGVNEDGKDFVENAVKKARHYARATGYLTIADDSGLEADALNGGPGVLSSRYAGEEGNSQKNIEKLLKELKDIPCGKRTARFRCVIALCSPKGETYIFEGTCEGMITEAPQGRAGFGYDPVFFYEPFGKTFAEVDVTEKNKVSHRGRALVKLKEFLSRVIGTEKKIEAGQ